MIGREREIQMHSGLFQSVVTLDDLFRDMQLQQAVG